jgi:hypothetical protein
MDNPDGLIAFTPDVTTAIDTSDMHAFSMKSAKSQHLLVCIDDTERDSWIRAINTAHLGMLCPTPPPPISCMILIGYNVCL